MASERFFERKEKETVPFLIWVDGPLGFEPDAMGDITQINLGLMVRPLEPESAVPQKKGKK